MKVKTKRRICYILGAMAFFFMLGGVGGMEVGKMTFKGGMIHTAACMGLWALTFYKAGAFKAR